MINTSCQRARRRAATDRPRSRSESKTSTRGAGSLAGRLKADADRRNSSHPVTPPNPPNERAANQLTIVDQTRFKPFNDTSVTTSLRDSSTIMGAGAGLCTLSGRGFFARRSGGSLPRPEELGGRCVNGIRKPTRYAKDRIRARPTRTGVPAAGSTLRPSSDRRAQSQSSDPFRSFHSGQEVHILWPGVVSGA